MPDLSKNSLIESIEKNYDGLDDSSSALIINFKKPVELRVFELGDLGRIVIDVREFQGL